MSAEIDIEGLRKIRLFPYLQVKRTLELRVAVFSHGGEESGLWKEREGNHCTGKSGQETQSELTA